MNTEADLREKAPGLVEQMEGLGYSVSYDDRRKWATFVSGEDDCPKSGLKARSVTVDLNIEKAFITRRVEPERDPKNETFSTTFFVIDNSSLKEFGGNLNQICGATILSSVDGDDANKGSDKPHRRDSIVDEHRSALVL